MASNRTTRDRMARVRRQTDDEYEFHYREGFDVDRCGFLDG
jgi:hypothetical protein